MKNNKILKISLIATLFSTMTQVVLAGPCIDDITQDLSKGSENFQVKLLQTFLLISGDLKVTPNGYFGEGTQNAVKSFQKNNKLKQSGVVDLTTRNKIKEISCGVNNATSSSAVKKEGTQVTPKAIDTNQNLPVGREIDGQCETEQCINEKIKKCLPYTFTYTSKKNNINFVKKTEIIKILGEKDGICKVSFSGEYTHKTENKLIKISSICLGRKEEGPVFLEAFRFYNLISDYLKNEITKENMQSRINASHKILANKISCTNTLEPNTTSPKEDSASLNLKNKNLSSADVKNNPFGEKKQSQVGLEVSKHNNQRISDVITILNATYAYYLDNKTLPSSIPATPKEICSTNATSCTNFVDLSFLTKNKKYLEKIPTEPNKVNGNGAGYKISKTVNNRITVTAQYPEEGAVITVTR
jgi:peptidoglycan hydrolase-like protein with peptidoglycan-binding domain